MKEKEKGHCKLSRNAIVAYIDEIKERTSETYDPYCYIDELDCGYTPEFQRVSKFVWDENE